jgi:serine/threonine protein kinase
MLAGYPPFFDDNPFGIYEKILAGKIEWPRHLDPVAKDLIKKLLVQDRTKRLGNMKVSFIYSQTPVIFTKYISFPMQFTVQVHGPVL